MKLFEILFWPITAPIKFIQTNFKATLLVIILFFVFTSNTKPLEVPNLSIIKLNGPIMDASLVLEKIEQAKNDTNIKGVLFMVNSPGGAVAPSVELAYALKELNAIKPVVSYASGVMASGSYYASIWSNKILANPGSTIGSIGVIMQSVDASELLQKIGIKPQSAKIGKYKEVGTPTRVWEAHEKEELEKVIKSTYDMFVNDVANARNLDLNRSTQFADAHIFTAIQAKEVGLIDDLSTISGAKKELQKLANVQNPIWEKEDQMDKFLEKIINESSTQIINQFEKKLMAY